MTEPDSTELVAVHRLRALTVELDLLGADFAQKHSLHPTDIRALICLLDADRAGTRATPGWLGRRVLLQVTAHAAELGTTFFGPVIDRAVNELARFTPEQRATIDEFLTAMHAVVAATREQQNP